MAKMEFCEEKFVREFVEKFIDFNYDIHMEFVYVFNNDFSDYMGQFEEDEIIEIYKNHQFSKKYNSNMDFEDVIDDIYNCMQQNAWHTLGCNVSDDDPDVVIV